MSLTVREQIQDNELMEVFEGELAGSVAKSQEKKLQEDLDQFAGVKMIWDFEKVNHIDSMGVSVIFQLFHSSRDKNVEFQIKKLSPYVKKVLLLASVDRFIKLID